ncbi:putative F-box protein [Abeliophyllum distichum]|uniref:F-box protein n=1 Tax=Abeliophyllum distichum TaxID=126358 RepID=A0ABD1VS26_9LAMI
MDCSLSLDMADWIDLPMDILVVIAESLTVIEDFTYFSAVCKEWKSATAILKKKPSLPTRYPRLMLSEKVDTKDQGNQDDRYFLNLLTSKTCKLKLPEASGRRCLGAHYGWLFTVGFDLQINLLHPFSRQQICLPPFLTFPAQRYEYDETYPPQEDIEFFVKKIAISSNPQNKNNLHDYNHECVILAIYGEFCVLAFARLGDTLWTNILVPSRCYDDVLYYKGRFYAVDCHGVVVVCDINDNNDPKATVVAPAPSETHDEIQKYLDDNSELYVIGEPGGGGRDTGIFDIGNGTIQSNYAGESRSHLSPPLCGSSYENVAHDDDDEEVKEDNNEVDDDKEKDDDYDNVQQDDSDEEEEDDDDEEKNDKVDDNVEQDDDKEDDDNDNEEPSYTTIGFSVLRLEKCQEKGNDCAFRWNEVTTLGDWALFLVNSVSLSSSNCIKANCIYFSEDDYELYSNEKGGGGYDTGIFNMEDGTIQLNLTPLWHI